VGLETLAFHRFLEFQQVEPFLEGQNRQDRWHNIVQME